MNVVVSSGCDVQVLMQPEHSEIFTDTCLPSSNSRQSLAHMTPREPPGLHAQWSVLCTKIQVHQCWREGRSCTGLKAIRRRLTAKLWDSMVLPRTSSIRSCTAAAPLPQRLSSSEGSQPLAIAAHRMDSAPSQCQSCLSFEPKSRSVISPMRLALFLSVLASAVLLSRPRRSLRARYVAKTLVPCRGPLAAPSQAGSRCRGLLRLCATGGRRMQGRHGQAPAAASLLH